MILTATVSGVPELAANVASIIARARAGLKVGVTSAALVFETGAKTEVPVVSGALRDAIHTEVLADEESVQAAAVVPGYESSNAYGFDPPYARRIEQGFIGVDSLGRHYHQAADPFMTRAYDSGHDAAMDALASAISDAIGGR